MDDFENDLKEAYRRSQGEAAALSGRVMDTIAHGGLRRRVVVAGAGLAGLAASAAVIGASGALGRLTDLAFRLRSGFSELGADLQPLAHYLWTPAGAALTGLILLALAGARLLLRES
jgi:hypothetical protein